MISFIIPAHNEEKYIEKTLKSIKNSDINNYEIIVVCDNCTDKTYDLSKKYTKKIYQTKKSVGSH